MGGAGYGRAYSTRRSSLASPDTSNVDSSLVFANDQTVVDTLADNTDSDSGVQYPTNNDSDPHDTLETLRNDKDPMILEVAAADIGMEYTQPTVSRMLKGGAELEHAQSLADTQKIEHLQEIEHSQDIERSRETDNSQETNQSQETDHSPETNHSQETKHSRETDHSQEIEHCHDLTIISLLATIDADTQKVLPHKDAVHSEQSSQIVTIPRNLPLEVQVTDTHREARHGSSRLSLMRKQTGKVTRTQSWADTQVIKPRPHFERANTTQESLGTELSHQLVNSVPDNRRVLHLNEALDCEEDPPSGVGHSNVNHFDADTQLIPKPPGLTPERSVLGRYENSMGAYKSTQLISRQQSYPKNSLPLSDPDSKYRHHDGLGESLDMKTSITTDHDFSQLTCRISTSDFSNANAENKPHQRTESLHAHKKLPPIDTKIPFGPTHYRATQLISRLTHQSLGEPAKPDDEAPSRNLELAFTDLHRQVINTQDQSGTENCQETSFHHNNRNDEQVHTDEECLLDTHEDSILTYRKRKRRRLIKGADVMPLSPRKIPSNKSKMLASVEQMLPPPTLEVIASPSEIGESSPTIKKCDILGSLVSLSPTNVILTLEKRIFELDDNNTSLDVFDQNESMNGLLGGGNEIVCLTQIDTDTANGKVGESVTNRSPQDSNGNFESRMPFASKHRAKFVVDSQSNDSSGATPNQVLRHETPDTFPDADFASNTGVWVSYDLKVLTGKLIENGSDLLRVQFSEGEYQIKSMDLFPLDIKIGDTVHIKSTTHKYAVTGLSSVDADSQPGSDIRCIRGYNCVHIVRIRHTKQEPETIVPLSTCFMELSDFIGRQTQPMEMIVNSTRDNPTVVSLGSRQHHHIPFSSPVGSRSSRTSPRKLFQPSIGDKVFSNKLFFITGFDADKKQTLRSMIESNGGLLVSESPCELLEFVFNERGTPLLDGSYMSRFLFAALLSPSHCRSAKYLQTIALGWPVLSSIYIEDCVRNPLCIEDWPLYLLPSGHSSILQCVQSCDIYRFRRNLLASRVMAEQTSINERLLAKHAVLVVENSSNLDTLNTCKLIFHAFGARLLDIFQKDTQVVSQVLSRSAEDRINHFLVYDESGIFAKTLERLSKCTPHAAGSAGRTRGKAAKIPVSRVVRDLYATAQDEMEISVVNWEWLVQCVISTRIWPAPSTAISREALIAHQQFNSA